jgi:hypothetical protein
LHLAPEFLQLGFRSIMNEVCCGGTMLTILLLSAIAGVQAGLVIIAVLTR